MFISLEEVRLMISIENKIKIIIKSDKFSKLTNI
ncbi:MAG: hypothetical protein RLZZ546_187 [Bacteroidota bacterium]